MRDYFVHVVDGNERARASISSLLAALGLSCLEYGSGNELLGRIHLRPPGCILIDTAAPGMSAFDVRKELLRREFRWPLLFMGSRPDAPEGAVAFVPKPIEDELLLATLHRGFAELNRLEGGLGLDLMARGAA